MSDGNKHPVPEDFLVLNRGQTNDPNEARAVMRLTWDPDVGVFRTAPCLIVADPTHVRLAAAGQAIMTAAVPFAPDGTLHPDKIREHLDRVLKRSKRSLLVDA